MLHRPGLTPADEAPDLSFWPDTIPGQGQIRRRRNILCADGRTTGATLFGEALAGGTQALGVPLAWLAPGATADFATLRGDVDGVEGDTIVDRWIFARGSAAIDGVWRAGRQHVADGRHMMREAVTARYARTLKSLLAS